MQSPVLWVLTQGPRSFLFKSPWLQMELPMESIWDVQVPGLGQ